jgi:hypothetical protein
MANISKAKEIYKSTPGKINPNKPFVPIRGLYVAGLYRPPYWIDSVLNVVKLATTSAADVAYYTEADAETHASTMSMIQFDVDLSYMDVTRYSTASGDIHTKNACMNMIQFDVDMSDLQVVRYYTDESSTYPEKTCMNMIQFEIDMNTTDIVHISQRLNTQPPGLPQLNVKQIGITTTAVIS